MTIGLKQLRYFARIAETGVMAHAAVDLGVAQSALSHHMTELEAALGVRLFERRPRGVSLTPAGERLQQHAASILASLDKAETDIRTFTSHPSGPIALGLCHTAIEVLSLPVMQRCAQLLPDVHLSIAEGGSHQLIAMLGSGDLDMVIGYNPPDDGRFASVPLLDEDMYLIGLPQIIGADTGPVEFADIPKGQVMGLNTARASRAVISSHMLRRQIEPNPQLELDSLNAIVKAMCAGLGCSVLARATVLVPLHQGRLHARLITEPRLTRSLHLISGRGATQTQAGLAVREQIVAAVRQAIGDGSWPSTSRL